MVVRAKAAKTGVYQYTGREIDPDNAHGLRDQSVVNVLRDEATVFDPAAVRTFIGKPITDDHPSVAVTADNWRDHGRGVIMGALRDGDHLAFDLLLMDGPTIGKVEAGKRQLSNGYAASLEFGDFSAPDGTKCQARQARISDGNHVAIVDRARGGETCCIGDAAPCAAAPQPLFDSLTKQEKPVKKIMLDGLSVDLSDAEAVSAAFDKLNAKASAAETALTDAKTALSTSEGKVLALETQLADAKAQLDPAKLDQRVADRAKLIADAKKIMPTVVTDAVSDADVRRAVVVGRLGEAAAGLDDSGIAGAFITMLSCEDAAPAVQPLGKPAVMTDEATAYVTDRAKAKLALTSAWKTPFNAADAAAA